MNYNTVEGNHCKDSKGFNSRHATRAVTPQKEEEEEISNEKLERRKDFKLKKKRSKLHVKASKIIIKPHSTVSYGDFVSNLKQLDMNFATEALETVLVAILVKARKSNLERALIIAAKLLKTHLGVCFGDVVTKLLLNKDSIFVKNILSWNLEDLESYMKELLNNWKVAHKNEAFSSLVSLVSTFLAIFYSADKKWSITIGSFSMFLFDAKHSCKGATSLVDAILKVSSYVISGLKKFLCSGSLSGFLYSDDQLGELDATVSQLQSQFSYIRPGNLGRFVGSDENTFDQQIQLAINSGEKLILLYDGPTKKFVMDKVRMLKQLHCDFIQTRATGGLRVAPFAYLVAGSTALGKSSVNEILMRYILSSNGFNHQDPYIVTLNSQDQYFSTYRSYINGVIFDDFANVNHQFVKDSPCDSLLKFVNNVPFYLNMAELELKGMVVAEPKVVGVTTNVNDINSSTYSNQPSSIMRRLKVHIYAKVKPEFQKEGSIEIDSSKVQQKFGSEVLAPDIWTFDVFSVKVTAIARPPKLDCGDVHVHKDDKWHLDPVQWNGHPMVGATICELLAYIKEATALHYVEQNAIIERSKKYGGKISCEECGSFFEYCTCSQSLKEATCSIRELQTIEEELNSGSSELFVNPHASVSGEETFYSRLFYARQQATEMDLKSMLFSWVMEGRFNLDGLCKDFISGCNKELQYLLIVSRTLVENWFTQNKKLMVEMCFPVELENTRLGDYYSLVVRKEEVQYISRSSYCVEILLRLLLLSSIVKFHYLDFWCGNCKYAIPMIGNYVISRMNIPFVVTRIYAESKASLLTTQQFVQTMTKDTKYCLIIIAILYWCSRNILFEYSSFFQMSILCVLTLYPFLESCKNTAMFDAPRALSLFYLKEKKDRLNDWSRMAPAALAMSTAYYSKDDIVDFYVEACEKWYLQPQSRLKPSISEVEGRDRKFRFDPDWFKGQAEPFLNALPVASLKNPSTPNEIRDAVENSVWFIENVTTTSKSNCFVLCSGCVLIPLHFVPKKASNFKVTRHNRGNKGNKSFEVFIEPSQCLRVGSHDLAMMWMPKTMDTRDLTKFFPESFHETSEFRSGRIATRDINGDIEWDDVKELTFTRMATSGLGFFFPGAHYIWSGAKEGKCMSPVISDDKVASISGLHIGGSTKCRGDGGYHAYAVTPTRGELLRTKEQLERFATVIPMSASSNFGVERMGVKVLDRSIKKKSCYLRVENDNSACFLGSSLNCNRTPKSQVRDTPIKDCVKTLFGVVDEWGPPKFKGPDGHSPHVPWELGMEKWIVDKPGLPFGLLNKAKTDYMNNLVHILFKEKIFWSQEIRLLTWDETVNGIPGKRFIDSMNFNSSIGFPFSGSKKLFSTNLGKVDGWQDKRILDSQFIEEAEKIEELYKKRERYYPWFISTLKDEPTLVTKEKVRVFQATSTPFQLVMRKYTLGICRFLQMNPLDSECAVGIDPCSSEWNEMFAHLKKAQTPFCDKWFAIDYKAYDTSIPSQMIIAVGRIFIDIAKIVGYSDIDIRILQSIFTDLSFSVVDFNGDVLMLDGANPSGNSLTVFINSLCNSLLMRIYFYHLYPRRIFSSNIRMMSYGDDLIAAVGSLAGNYTMKGYATYLKQFGFVVTPAQKDEELKNFSKLCEIDFLKRKFVWSDDYGTMIAPLEEASIYKRLCNYMSSETSVEVIVGANVDGALDEWAFYGKAIYLDRQKKLIKIVEEFELHRFTHRLYLTYEQRVSLWKQNNADPAVMGKGQGMDTNLSNCDSDWLGFFGWGNIISKMGIGGPPHSHNSGSISSDDQMSINQWTTNTTQQTNYKNSIVEAIKPLAAEELDLQEWGVGPHSSSFSMEKHELMTMTDGSSNQMVEIPNEMEATRYVNDSSDNSLGAFLARPVKISSFDWTPGTDINFTTTPWSLFLTNKRVCNRVANFKLLRAKMKIKILINGNSFFYGRLMVSYWPLAAVDDMTINNVNDVTNVQFSQMPRIFLDPTTSQGGEMTLPFFWPADYLDIVRENGSSLGYLSFKTLNSLKHTSGDVSVNTRVSVSVFAWMEDVQLEAPTGSNPVFIVPQSTNPSMPSGDRIRPYAMGSEFDPQCPVGPDVTLLEPRGISNMMLTDSKDSTNKLSFTSAQGLTVDPRVLGLGDLDEMTIAGIASRETWLTNFNWPLSASRDDLLWNVRVTPALWNSVVESLETRIQIVASCGAVLPFRYWNGTFKLRLQIVSSAFHRGRLAVVYDPHSTKTPREDNVAYTQIVDISECRDVTFKVGMNQDRQLLTYGVPTDVPTSVIFGTGALGFSLPGNGTLAIYVLNELAIPNALPAVNNDIEINAYVSMDDDFAVYGPSSNFSSYTIVPQSTGVDVNTDIIDTVQVSEPYEGQQLQLDSPNAVNNDRDKVFVGERILTFRAMLKRYYPWAAFLVPASAGVLQALEITHRILPAYRGGLPGAVHSAGGTPYNYFAVSLLNFLTPAFQGWRGSVRYKLFPRCKTGANAGNGVARITYADTAGYATSVATFDTTTASKTAHAVMFGGAAATRAKGAITVVQGVNPSMEYEIPWWESMRFCAGKFRNWTGTPAGEYVPVSGASISIDSSSTAASIYDSYVSAGDDFSLYFFTGWPALYYKLTAPTP